MKHKRTPVTDALLKLMMEPYQGDPKKRLGCELVALAIFKASAEGSVPASQLLVERIEGKITDKVELTSEPHTDNVIERIQELVKKLREPGESSSTIQ